jgi:hypothetical protein
MLMSWKTIFYILSAHNHISTQSSMQCCSSGFSLNADRLTCESDEGEVEVVGMNLCQGDMVVVDSRYTSFSYYGGKKVKVNISQIN